MSASYHLSSIPEPVTGEVKVGGPEKPLSEMGRRSYTHFWEQRVARWILAVQPASAGGKKTKSKNVNVETSVKEIAAGTGMMVEDVVAALTGMGIVEKKAVPSITKVGKSGKTVNEAEVELAVISKERVRTWVEENEVDLREMIEEEGFLEEFATR